MPAPQASMLGQLAKTNFAGHGIKLPLNWKQPNGGLFTLTLTVLAVLFLGGRIAVADSMSDPLLGLSYNVNKYLFEVFDGKRFPANAPTHEKTWIYAHYKDSVDDIFIISGLITIKPDGPGQAVTEPDFGLAVRVRDNSIDPIGVPDRLFGSAPVLPPGVVDALMKDAARRYLKGFGSLSVLQSEIDKQQILATDLPAVMKKRFEEIGVSFR